MVDSRRLACGPLGQSRSHSWCSKRKWGDAGSLPSEAEGKMRPPDQGSGEAGLGLLLAEGTRPKQKARLEARRAVFSPLSLKTSGSQTQLIIRITQGALQTDRQTQTQTQTQTHTHTQTQTHTQTHTHTQTQTDRQTDRHTHTHTLSHPDSL